MSEVTAQEIHNDILNQIEMESSPYSHWYVGITSNPHIKLFQEHNVEVRNSWWVIKRADSVREAKNIKKTLTEIYGTDGGRDTEDEKSIYIYAYKKTATTNPKLEEEK